jgi:hypothetical protein
VFGPASRQGKREARPLAGSCNQTVHYPVNLGDRLALGDAFGMMGPTFNGPRAFPFGSDIDGAPFF